LEDSKLEEEIESWRGFPWALRKDDRELWNTMIRQVRESYSEAVERSGKDLAVDPFFMSLILSQQKIIQLLQREINSLKGKAGGLTVSHTSLLDFLS
jgi:hypothetical protein